MILYTNREHRFTISIPSVYAHIEERAFRPGADQITFAETAEGSLQFTMTITADSGVSLDALVKNELQHESNGYSPQTKHLLISGVQSIRVSGTSETSGGIVFNAASVEWVQYYLVHQGAYYVIAKTPLTDMSTGQFDAAVTSLVFK